MSPDDPRHGLPRGFHAHVRDGETPCEPCRDAVNRYERRRRKTRTLYRLTWEIDATGTRRRIQALYRMGWRGRDIAARVGAAQARIDQLASGRQVAVHRHTAAAIAAVYKELCMTPGPSPITATRAERKGYAPPLAWDDIDHDEHPRGIDNRPADDPDPVVVERILAGERLHATRAERREVIRHWTGTLGELERLTGWNVSRDLREMRAEVAA